MIKIKELSNGLRVVSDKMEDCETVSVSINIGIGSRHETIEQNGISHFLEHMLFKGTKSRSALDIAKEFDDIGGYFNAGTSRESTCYYAKVLKEDVNIAVDILADIIQNSVFDESEIKKERGVILQEIAMCNDTPDDIVFDYYQEVAFENQPVGRSILGSQENVKNFTKDDIVDYIKDKYTSENIVLSIAGNFEEDKFFQLAKEKFSATNSNNKAKFEPAIYSGGYFTKKTDHEQVQFLMGFKSCSYMEDEVYKAQILSIIASGGMSSRLFQEVREKLGIAYNISSFNTSYEDSGLFTIYAGTSSENLNQLIDVVCVELVKLTQNITQEELKRAKTQYKSSILMSAESSSHRADKNASNIVSFDKIITKQEILDCLDKITCDDLCDFMKNLLRNEKPTICMMGNLDKPYEFEDICNKLR